jgi:hypothetical protein
MVNNNDEPPQEMKNTEGLYVWNRPVKKSTKIE